MAELLVAENLRKYFPVRQGLFRKVREYIRAVDGVSLRVRPGETLGVVGESGCGKSTLGRVLVGLHEADAGSVLLYGKSLKEWRKQRKAFHRQVQLIFQDPMDSLDPRYTVAQSVSEPLRGLDVCKPAELRSRVETALTEVQLPLDLYHAYPHELSGGMRQRVVIARAIVVNPAFVVCDEPVSSLDLSIQGQVLDLLKALQRKHLLGYLFISHDLSVVETVSDRVAVMYLGKIVEQGTTQQVIHSARHPYTEALLAAVPRIDTEGRVIPVKALGGEPPSPKSIPSGCRFRLRCPLAEQQCAEKEPELVENPEGHAVACHLR